MESVNTHGAPQLILARSRLSRYQKERIHLGTTKVPSTFAYGPINPPNYVEDEPCSADKYQSSEHEDRSSEHEEADTPPLIPFVVFIFNLVLTFLPLIFIVLAFCAVAEHGQPSSHRGRTVMKVQKLAPTLFPIVFAAVVGRLTRTYALWQAERGATVGLLELLTGSQNLASAMQRVVMLRQYGLMSIVLIVLWLLSPLGGQSPSRLLYLRDTEIHSTAAVAWHNVYAARFAPDGSSLSDLNPSVSNNVYVASMLQSRESVLSPQDSWGNVKIPYMEELLEFDLNEATDGNWQEVNQWQQIVYSSLTGIPVAGLKSGQRSSFLVGSRYFKLQPIDQTQSGGDEKSTGGEAGMCDWFGTLPDLSNANAPCVSKRRNSCAPKNIMMSLQCGTTEMDFAIWVGGGHGWYQYKFNVSAVDVESQVVCEGRVCSVTRMRYLTDETAPDIGLQPGDLQSAITLAGGASIPPRQLYLLMCAFSTLFNYTVGNDQPQNEAFYASGFDPPYTVELSLGSIQESLESLTADRVGVRLTTLLNTYFQANSSGTMLASQAQADDTSMLPWNQYPMLTVSANISTTVTLYAYDPVFVSLTLITSTVLLTCGFLGLFFRYNAIAPDIIGYVSTMARDNPHFSLPTGHGMLDGIERARLLRDVRVQIAEVADVKDGDIGHVALRDVDREEDVDEGRLRKWTKYS